MAGIGITERCRIDPESASVRRGEFVINSRERIANEVQVRPNFIERLSAVEVPQAAHLPPVDKPIGPSMGPRRLGHLVHQTCREEMPGVEVTVAVVQLEVRKVVRDDCTILADLVQRVGPGVAECGGQSVPRPESEGALNRVIVRSADAANQQYVAEVWNGTILIDIGDYIQLPPLAADVSNLENGGISEALFDLQAVVIEVGRAEVLADSIGAQALRVSGGGAIGIGADLNARKDRTAACLNSLPVIGILAVGGNGARTKRVALNPL